MVPLHSTVLLVVGKLTNHNHIPNAYTTMHQVHQYHIVTKGSTKTYSCVGVVMYDIIIVECLCGNSTAATMGSY